VKKLHVKKMKFIRGIIMIAYYNSIIKRSYPKKGSKKGEMKISYLKREFYIHQCITY